ncbi:MAG: hypothetical protein ACLR43_02465 [Faecalibacillus faecis]
MQKIKLEAENDLEKRCKNLKEQNEALINGWKLQKNNKQSIWFASRILSAKENS